jgi:hypothetical protein
MMCDVAAMSAKHKSRLDATVEEHSAREAELAKELAAAKVELADKAYQLLQQGAHSTNCKCHG